MLGGGLALKASTGEQAPPPAAQLEENGPAGTDGGANRGLSRGLWAVHALTLLAAVGLWAFLDRHLWFFGDEWDFLTRRGLHGAYFSLWAPHNEHWSVLPILLWRGIYSAFHLSSYWPYIVPVLLVHACIVHLVWRRCLADGAEPWVATALACLLALFGPGAEDLTWAFQIGFLGSVLFGLLAWEVADRAVDGGRRWAADAGMAALALAAMMCSTVGLAASAGLAVLLAVRTGWLRAGRVLCVPAGIYAFWFALSGHYGMGATGDSISIGVFLRSPIFLAWNLADVLGSMAALVAIGPVIGIVLGLWVFRHPVTMYRSHPSAAAGLVAALSFFALAAVGRDRISLVMSPSRYIYIGAAFLAPLCAVALSALLAGLANAGRPDIDLRADRLPPGGGHSWLLGRYARPLMLCGLALAILANVNGGWEYARSRTAFVNGLKSQIVASGALLQSPLQAQRAIDFYPVRDSGNRAGYLSAPMIAQLYREHLLGVADLASVAPHLLLSYESWLDITHGGQPLYRARLYVLSRPGDLYRLASTGPRGQGLGQGWRRGPGDCVVAKLSDHVDSKQRQGAYLAWVSLGTSGAKARGSVWVTLGPSGGVLFASLRRPWGAPAADEAKSPSALGEQVDLSAGSYAWLSDSVPGDGLVVRAQGDATLEVCALAAPVAKVA